MPFPDFTPTDRIGNMRCGWDSTTSELCNAPATWHIAWNPTNPLKLSLLCDPHMNAVNHHYTYADRHPATIACDMPGTGWLTTVTPSRCIPADTTDLGSAGQLRAAAVLLRNPVRRPELASVVDLPFIEPLADWLESTAAQLDAITHPLWQAMAAAQPLAVARQILGKDTS
ncbi:hypothetical protein AB0O20_27600 [Streptomyces kronopolitis]|uniref:hypothetical protein n=1 Tax=Streptomyces kronopolitis TaxID=1612435 RepID=UPI00343A7807